MLGDDDFVDSSFENALNPFTVPLDRAVVAQAQVHLRAHSPQQRKWWRQQIEIVLTGFASARRYRRQPVHIGAGRTRFIWFPQKGSDPVLTDTLVLLDPSLRSFPEYVTLARKISDQPGLAQLVMASLLVQRDCRLGDFASVHAAREIFDGSAAALARIVVTARARRNAQKDRTAKKYQPILRHLKALSRKNIPKQRWTMLTLKAMRKQNRFVEKSEPALIRTIQRIKKAYRSKP